MYMQEPFIIKEYNDIYFVYKPPFGIVLLVMII